MYSEYKIVTLYLKQPNVRKKWETLLKQEGIERLDVTDYTEVDLAIGLYDEDRLIGTVSCQKNIIKYVAIDSEYREEGKTFNRLLSSIIQEMASQSLFHLFVATKPEYQKSFEYIGFKLLAGTSDGVLLETGNLGIADYLADLPIIKGEKIASIVMNANPFTLGHHSLVTKAAKENDVVYLFVLSEEHGPFTSKERFDLVVKGVRELENVIVLSGEAYIISPATFPTYFLREDVSATHFQTEMDALIFKEKIASHLGITRRYLGEEPLSDMTEHYNKTLKKTLSPDVEVIIVPRKKTAQGEIISASSVRQAFKDNDFDTIRRMTPESTSDFLKKSANR